LGAAAYAAKAAGLAAPNRPEAVSQEIRWQLGRMPPTVRASLRQLPPVGQNASGPLGPGLLGSGSLGTIVRQLQAGLADPQHRLRRGRTRQPLSYAGSAPLLLRRRHPGRPEP
jgi:hypothetical protein